MKIWAPAALLLLVSCTSPSPVLSPGTTATQVISSAAIGVLEAEELRLNDKSKVRALGGTLKGSAALAVASQLRLAHQAILEVETTPTFTLYAKAVAALAAVKLP